MGVCQGGGFCAIGCQWDEDAPVSAESVQLARSAMRRGAPDFRAGDRASAAAAAPPGPRRGPMQPDGPPETAAAPAGFQDRSTRQAAAFGDGLGLR